MKSRLIQLILLALVLVTSIGCKSGPSKRAQVSQEEIDQIIAFHNQRVELIERVWARISVRIKGRDAQGDWFEEQGEGHLQVVRPDSVSLTIGKLGETYFAYGSNADQYWMFDLSDSDRRVGLFGMVENITPQRAMEIGLSVHPGDLIAVLGIEPIDPDSILETRWEKASGLVAIRFPSRSAGWGQSEYWFDPVSALPVMVRSLDDEGNRLATTGLTRYEGLLDDHKLESDIPMPAKVEIRDPEVSGGFVRLELSESSQKSIRAMVFQPDRLSRAYRIHEMVDLDALPED